MITFLRERERERENIPLRRKSSHLEEPLGNSENFLRIREFSAKSNKPVRIPIFSKTFALFRKNCTNSKSCSQLLNFTKEIMRRHDSRHLGTCGGSVQQHNSCGPSVST